MIIAHKQILECVDPKKTIGLRLQGEKVAHFIPGPTIQNLHWTKKDT